jgi:hypothetical protein
VQTDEVGDIGVQAAGVVSNFLEELHSLVASPDIGVLVDFESDLLAVSRCVLRQLADQRSGPTSHLRRLVVVPALGQPEPQHVLLFSRQLL